MAEAEAETEPVHVPAKDEWVDVAPALKVRVFSWNILADTCADNSPQGFPFVPDEALHRDLREPMQIKEIFKDDADVIALQEVDNLWTYEQPLQMHGYEVLYNRRDDSPLGVLVAYKHDKYKLKAKNMITFTRGGQVATIVKLEDNETHRSFVFATTHLKAKNDASSKVIREKQATELLFYITNMSDDWEDRVDFKKRNAELKGNVIVAGDLNDEPSSWPVKTFTEQDNFTISHQGKYDICEKTTFKSRKSPNGIKITRCSTEDYIIHNGTTACRRVLRQDFEDPFLPSLDYPSDHLSLCADLVFVN